MSKPSELEALAKEYASRYGFTYGHDEDQIELKDVDARCSPYNYQLVQYANDSGGFIRMFGPATKQEMIAFLSE